MLEPLSEQRLDTAQDVIVLAVVPSHANDGIYDYTRHLADSLGARPDVAVTLRNPRLESVERLAELVPPAPDRTLTVVLQYNPFSFGRWGFAPWLPAKLWRLKRFTPRLRVALMVHETYMPVSDWRTGLMGAWQRVQFFAVRALSDVVFTSIAPWAARFATYRPARPVYHLPVGSNLPDARPARTAERARLGAAEETVVLAAFGTNHPSRMMDYVADAAMAVASTGSPTLLLNLGADVPPIDAGGSVDVVTPGRLEGEEVARLLAASDIFLAPFIDGVSTRRTTVMAALQHGLPVIGTDGHLTDPVLREADPALRLVPVRERDSFARAAVELATDPLRRLNGGSLARSLYEREFDWPVVSSKLVDPLLNGSTWGCG